MIICPLLDNSFRYLHIFCRLIGSTSLVGSSRTIIGEGYTTAIANEVSLLSPPESFCPGISFHPSIFNSFKILIHSSSAIF